ncbi:MAG TPA: DUF1700 domain-containing protein [Candidatus Mediterraneibacter gallistercoris]|uniref:DUF1700 domain-containing protein n=1 Tax=Candidatus Mediterraneibacter gallistercoris TaxID=2838671 RepID=A0A9D2T2H8_9FIRM|nr:DUF1700 domain-containing protein [Candidatus Mediterraneibacter gallistercoris]
MNRVEFMAELERLLSAMPEEERQAAVRYYADYFADAGEANEAEVIRELGSPEKVAESIKADYYGTEFNESDYEHKDYMEKYGQRSSDERDNGRENSGAGTGQSGAENRGGSTAENTGNSRPWTSNALKLILIIAIAIILWPVTLGIALTVFGVVVAVVCFFAVLVIAAVSIMIAGGVTVIVGLVAAIAVPPAALVTVGIGILLFVFGLIAAVGAVKLCIIVYPAMLRGFVNLCRRPFYGKAV